MVNNPLTDLVKVENLSVVSTDNLRLMRVGEASYFSRIARELADNIYSEI